MTELLLYSSSPVVVQKQADNDDQLIELWLFGRCPRTRTAYQRDVARFRAFVLKPLPTVTLRDFQIFVESLAGATASKRLAVASLKSLFSFGMKIGYLHFNVAAVVHAPKADTALAERILPEASVQRMIALAGSRRDQMLLRVLYASGVRVSELCGASWRNCQANGDSGQITVMGKGAKIRSIVLPTGLWKDLMEFRGQAADEEPVFASTKGGGHLDRSQAFRIIKAAAKKAGIKMSVSPHWLRHAHASHALDRGAALNLVQVTLGHASLSTTGMYLHAKPHDSSARYLAV